MSDECIYRPMANLYIRPEMSDQDWERVVSTLRRAKTKRDDRLAARIAEEQRAMRRRAAGPGNGAAAS